MKKYVSMMFIFVLMIGFFAYPLNANQKKWTVMIFLNGDNNLDSAGVDDVNEMAKIGSNDDLNIIVLHDREHGSTYRKYVKKNSVVKENVGEVDMGDWREALKFFKWGVDNYPAEHYFFAIWNHGAGWKLRRSKDEVIKGVSYDDDSGNHITTPQLGLLAKAMYDYIGRKIDIFGFDACLMQMAEVGFEIKDYVKYIIGSEETEPGDGWPYDDLLRPLAENPDMTPLELAKHHVKAYNESYNGGSQGYSSVTHSAIDATKLDKFVNKLNELLDIMLDNSSLVSVYKDAMAKAQSYAYSDYKDLYDYLNILRGKISDFTVKNKIDEVLNILTGNDPLIVANGYVGSSLKGSYGLSIWLPNKYTYDSKKDKYKELKFSAVSKWDELIEAFYYPNFPVLKIASIVVKDENNDGRIAPGERIEFKVKVTNEGTKPGYDVKVRVTVSDTNASIEGFGETSIASVAGMGSVIADGIFARISSMCPSNKRIKFRVHVLYKNSDISKDYEILVRKPFEVNNKVLLIVKDAENRFTKYYTDALDMAGIKYDMWDIKYEGPITAGMLLRYVGGVVIYNAPDASDIEKVKADDLANYLENGGSLFITGQDVGYKLKNHKFYIDYLHAKYVQDNTKIHGLRGVNALNGINIKISGGDGANNQKWPDEIDVIAPAKLLFKYDTSVKEVGNNEYAPERVDNYRGIYSSGGGALYVDTNKYKVVYFAFGFEAISDANTRANIMKKVINMLMPKLSDRVMALINMNKKIIRGINNQSMELARDMYDIIEMSINNAVLRNDVEILKELRSYKYTIIEDIVSDTQELIRNRFSDKD